MYSCAETSLSAKKYEDAAGIADTAPQCEQTKPTGCLCNKEAARLARLRQDSVWETVAQLMQDDPHLPN